MKKLLAIFAVICCLGLGIRLSPYFPKTSDSRIQDYFNGDNNRYRFSRIVYDHNGESNIERVGYVTVVGKVDENFDPKDYNTVKVTAHYSIYNIDGSLLPHNEVEDYENFDDFLKNNKSKEYRKVTYDAVTKLEYERLPKYSNGWTTNFQVTTMPLKVIRFTGRLRRMTQS